MRGQDRPVYECLETLPDSQPLESSCTSPLTHGHTWAHALMLLKPAHALSLFQDDAQPTTANGWRKGLVTHRCDIDEGDGEVRLRAALLFITQVLLMRVAGPSLHPTLLIVASPCRS